MTGNPIWDPDDESFPIKDKPEWDTLLASGAEILDEESKFFKVFRYQGKLWRVMPQYRRAWRIHINDER